MELELKCKCICDGWPHVGGICPCKCLHCADEEKDRVLKSLVEDKLLKSAVKHGRVTFSNVVVGADLVPEFRIGRNWYYHFLGQTIPEIVVPGNKVKVVRAKVRKS